MRSFDSNILVMPHFTPKQANLVNLRVLKVDTITANKVVQLLCHFLLDVSC